MPAFLRGWRGPVVIALALLLVLGLGVGAVLGVQHFRSATSTSTPVVSVLSSRPDAVSGGSALIGVTTGSPGSDQTVRMTVNGVDQSDRLQPGPAGMQGVVDHLVAGRNTVRVTAKGGSATEQVLVNHPSSGPVFAGKRAPGFRCETTRFRSSAKVPLGPALDASCSIAPQVGYVYRSAKTGRFAPLRGAALSDAAQRPADLAQADLPDGQQVPFIVRVETRSIDRGIAETAMLADPSEPVVTAAHWNHKLVYTFGGSCGPGNTQGTRTVGILSPGLLAQGFALASNSLNAMEQNCNEVVAAEAFAMTREQFIKFHGLPTYTMGLGCSGGATQAYGIADNYPGLLDGLVVGCSVADLASDEAQLLFDARLLDDLDRRHPELLDATALEAVAGVGSLSRLAALSRQADILDPVANLSPSVPAQKRYDAKTNPGGVRGSVWDQSPLVYRTLGSPPRAAGPLDNVGVQYGLAAFQSKAIDFTTFLELNRLIGGRDLDFRPTTSRTVGSRRGTDRAYATGRVLSGGALANIPIIDYRSVAYRDGLDPTVALDMRVQSFIVQNRLIEQTGNSGNLVLLTDAGQGRFDLERGVVADAIAQMDRWITKIKSSGGRDQLDVTVAKPADLVDACYDRSRNKISEPQTLSGPTTCNTLYPVSLTPRMAAGAPVSGNVVRCTLKRIDPLDYKPAISVKQAARLAAVFPRGVCNWRSPGIGQRRPTGAWTSY